MVKYSDAQLDSTFAALSDPTRRAILARLCRGDTVVTELASPFEMSLAAVSKHLNVLERAGLIVRQKDGRIRRCQLKATPLKMAADWIEAYRHYWEPKLDSLGRYLNDTSTKGAK